MKRDESEQRHRTSGCGKRWNMKDMRIRVRGKIPDRCCYKVVLTPLIEADRFVFLTEARIFGPSFLQAPETCD